MPAFIAIYDVNTIKIFFSKIIAAAFRAFWFRHSFLLFLPFSLFCFILASKLNYNTLKKVFQITDSSIIPRKKKKKGGALHPHPFFA
jgi:hypothetical protein